MTLQELEARARDLVSDPDNDFWKTLSTHLNQAVLDFVDAVDRPRIKVAVALEQGKFKYPIPASCLRITEAFFEGEPLEIKTESELNEEYSVPSWQYGDSTADIIQTTIVQENKARPSSWRYQTGIPLALILDQRTVAAFRVFPIPDDVELVCAIPDAYQYASIIPFLPAWMDFFPQADKLLDMTVQKQNQQGTVVYLGQSVSLPLTVEQDGRITSVTFRRSILLEAVKSPTPMTQPDHVPDGVPVNYHKDLVFGALAYAYLKEGEFRNATKADVCSKMFETKIAEAILKEQTNPLTYARRPALRISH